MGWVAPFPHSCVEVLTSSPSECDCVPNRASNEVIRMGSKMSHIQYGWRRLPLRHTRGDDHVRTQKEHSYLQAKQRGSKPNQVAHQPNSLAGIWTWTPVSRMSVTKERLWAEPPGLWYVLWHPGKLVQWPSLSNYPMKWKVLKILSSFLRLEWVFI